MRNDEIPDKIWELKNQVLEKMKEVTRNEFYNDYKYCWVNFAHICLENGEKIEKLIKQYEQPKEK